MSFSRLFDCISVAAVVFSIGAPEVFAQEAGRLRGRVLLEGTDEPVVGAVVRALPDGLDSLARPEETVTDNNGRFTINWIRSGMWQAIVSAEGFAESRLTVEVTQGESYACNPNQLMRCREPIEFSMVRVVDPMHPTEAPSVGALAGIRADDIQAEVDAAHDLFDSGEYDDAIASYEVVLEQVPLLTSLHLQIGHAYRAKQDYERALLAYRAVPADTTAGAEAESAIQDLEALRSGR